MKKTKVVSVINYKGGVGKSTITYNLGAELSYRGFDVLLIDFDGQGNLTKFTGVEKNGKCAKSITTVLNNIIAHEDITEDPIYQVSGNLDLIPCDISKEKWSNSAISVMARETILKRYIDSLKETCDYILIDNAPSINLDFQNSLVAADKYLIVTEPEIASIDGIETIFQIIRQIKECFNKDLSPIGIVINKAELKTNLHTILATMIRDVWGESLYVFNSAIPKSIIVGESVFMSKPICEYKKDSKIGDAFKALTAEFIERTK